MAAVPFTTTLSRAMSLGKERAAREKLEPNLTEPGMLGQKCRLCPVGDVSFSAEIWLRLSHV